MDLNKTIVQSTSEAKNLTTLACSVKEVGLIRKSERRRLVPSLGTDRSSDENRRQLEEAERKIKAEEHSHHVVPGELITALLKADINRNLKFGPEASKTGNPTFAEQGGNMRVADSESTCAEITFCERIADF